MNLATCKGDVQLTVLFFWHILSVESGLLGFSLWDIFKISFNVSLQYSPFQRYLILKRAEGSIWYRCLRSKLVCVGIGLWLAASYPSLLCGCPSLRPSDLTRGTGVRVHPFGGDSGIALPPLHECFGYVFPPQWAFSCLAPWGTEKRGSDTAVSA